MNNFIAEKQEFETYNVYYIGFNLFGYSHRLGYFKDFIKRRGIFYITKRRYDFRGVFQIRLFNAAYANIKINKKII
jgi:hypothetical protein